MDVFYITVKRRIIDCPMWKPSRNKKLPSLFPTLTMCKKEFKRVIEQLMTLQNIIMVKK